MCGREGIKGAVSPTPVQTLLVLYSHVLYYQHEGPLCLGISGPCPLSCKTLTPFQTLAVVDPHTLLIDGPSATVPSTLRYLTVPSPYHGLNVVHYQSIRPQRRRPPPTLARRRWPLSRTNSGSRLRRMSASRVLAHSWLNSWSQDLVRAELVELTQIPSRKNTKSD
ncbi:hypothetical protein C8F01DRAFT_107337 [Mycena amicta]|nr:hypothetical protein C8F01DRAFT_107337 [Mycena amicta]